jgi:hypothetical protein
MSTDSRRWHIFKTDYPPNKPWHIELTNAGQHCPSPNEPTYATFEQARVFVSNHVTGHVRRHRQETEFTHG